MHKNKDDFFDLRDMREGMAQLEKISRVIKIALGSIAGFSLLVGEGMALLAVNIVNIAPEWPSVISTQWVIISVSFSALIGVSFGLYPTLKVSSLSPIEALRIE